MIEKNGPLSGITIVDFTHVWQGPVSTQLLGDLGANVIKIERPDVGDWTRRWGPYINGFSMPFAGLNRNKKSVAIDVKSRLGKEVVFRLLKNSDVLVHNFRPGTMEKLGFGYDELHEKYPHLVYAVTSGWGDRGPYVERQRAGHDVLARAATGWFEPHGSGGLPIPVGMSLDYPAGLTLTIGILSALLYREKTGKGQRVSTDLFSVGCHANTWNATAILNKERVPVDSDGIGAIEDLIGKSFRTQDGFIELSAVFSDHLIRDISTALDLGDLSQDERFGSMKAFTRNYREFNRILATQFATRKTDEWVLKLEAAGVISGRINTFEEAMNDPQAVANEMIISMDTNVVGVLKLLGTPLRFSDSRASFRIAPSILGEHTREVMSDLGFNEAEIAEMEGLNAPKA